MTSLAMSEQWTQLQKSTKRRPVRSNSEVSSPESIRSEQFEFASENFETEEARRDQFHTRYLSSEEDLSSEDADMAESLLDFDDDVEVYEVESAEAVPFRIANKPIVQHPGQLAQLVCIVPATPTLVDVPPTPQSYRFSAPAGHYPRFTSSPSSSNASARSSPSSVDERRRRTIHDPTTSRMSISESSTEHTSTTTSRTSTWPSTHDSDTKRQSSFEPRLSSLSYSPPPPSFLSSDPFNSDTQPPLARSPSTTHRRLRSISKSLVMAKLTISPKKSVPPPTPPPQPRRLVPRAGTQDREPSITADLLAFLDSSPERPAAPCPERQQQQRKLIPRGAAERESTFDFGFLDDGHDEQDADEDDARKSAKPRNLRRKKSLLGLRNYAAYGLARTERGWGGRTASASLPASVILARHWGRVGEFCLRVCGPAYDERGLHSYSLACILAYVFVENDRRYEDHHSLIHTLRQRMAQNPSILRTSATISPGIPHIFPSTHCDTTHPEHAVTRPPDSTGCIPTIRHTGRVHWHLILFYAVFSLHIALPHMYSVVSFPSHIPFSHVFSNLVTADQT
ncbi:hypothetical protein EJ05DRAFT_520316 [Pseudovirgaria hyperparasitica]|uniref:Uncharacterized protein n=1 Tax=Pseudovirgaria hyperparasitica TaxID=470096 RepID=A0A6A6VXL1_9PEZI|nr:uncharacterized protein EJ05DRAFT_520316 [Pseudovirgaria hyperparasitica]KAF2754915.1 hypothetical protein EJ05DRAFT_520316 [Pseudovirgaria hyperparasitica]